MRHLAIELLLALSHSAPAVCLLDQPLPPPTPLFPRVDLSDILIVGPSMLGERLGHVIFRPLVEVR